MRTGSPGAGKSPAWWEMSLLLLLVFLGAVESRSDNIFYVVLLPAKLHFPSTQKICLQLNSDMPIAEKILVTATLEVKGQKMEVIKYKGFACSLLCQTFTVPPPEGGQMEVGTVHVEGKGGVKFNNQKTVQIQRIDNGVVVQTDKPTYRAGQTLLFRILTLNEKFLTPKKQYNLIELKDAKNNRIAQWQNIYTSSGIVDLSFNLTNEPLLGSYTISVENGQALKTFIVNEDVLPRFEVTIDSPNKVFIRDSSFHLKVCGRYTYGKRVNGIVVINMCRASYDGINVLCIAAEGQTDSSGCFSSKIWTNGLNLTMYRYMENIKIIASVEDSATGVSVKTSKNVPISRSSGTLRFEKMDSYYKAGYTYPITLVMEDLDGRPIQFTEASLQITFPGQTITVRDKTNAKGRISFKLDTSKWTGTVQLTGFYKIMYLDYSKVGLDDPFYSPSYHSVLPYYSKAQSTINMSPVFGVIKCGQRVNVHVVYELYQNELWPGANSVEFSFIVIGGPGILMHGSKVIKLSKANPVKGSIYIPIVFTSTFAPAPTMIGYILLKGIAMAAGRLRFSVEKCFPNKVNLQFPVKETLPKAQMDLLVTASNNSLCGLRVVDKSTQISYADQELTPDKIYSLFPYMERSGYDYSVDESQSWPCWGPRPIDDEVLPLRRQWKPWTWDNQYMDILGLFKDVGMKILTNAQIQKPVERINCRYPALIADMMLKEGNDGNGEPPSMPIPEAAVRKNFPETWLWNLMPVGETGRASLKVTVPDTITEWIGGILCTGIYGFGLSPPASLRVFKPFFVEMSLPYSVVREEFFTLKASVFNYLSGCIKVNVSVSASKDVQVAACPSCQYSLSVCSNRAILFKWNVTAKTAGMVTFTVTATTVLSTELYEGQKIILPATGRTDVERRQLLVKPGGIRKEEAQSFIYCLKDTHNEATGSFSLQLPSTVVEGSVSAYVAVMGDLLGSALQNLNNLVQMPYGCGEQNMLTTSSIVYVLKYLEATGRLTPELRSLATGYLQSGYQRQLNYKHSDGSFSAFGESDSEGSTWLTAFVVLCFSQARPYIFVDDDLLNKALMWLKSLQQPGGCFMNKGRVIHTLMKGGVEDDLSLSAYVTAAILGLGVPRNDTVLVNALTCLRDRLSNLTNPYTMALFAYVFSLANDTTIRAMLLNNLYQIAQTSDGETYWDYTLQSGSYGGVSAKVELTAYVMLALVSVPNVSTGDILKAAQIVKWLVRQQNPNGGYSSTQDTVVAIHALTEYLRLTYSGAVNILVTVNGSNGFVKQFQVYKNNSLLLQREDLPNVPGDYSFHVSGSGCVFIQCVLKYNVYPTKHSAAFALDASVSHSECNKQGLQQFRLRISARYIGSRNATNMVLMEVGMLSGFSPSADTITMFLTMSNVKKVTTTPTSVTIYFEQLTSKQEVYELNIEQNFVVNNMKPAVIKIYDYYLPEESAEISYTVKSQCD